MSVRLRRTLAPPEQTLWDVYQVARRYGIRPDTVQSWLRQGKFPQPLRLGRKCSRWSIDDLKRWEDEKRAEQAPRSQWLDRQRRQQLRDVKACRRSGCYTKKYRTGLSRS